MQLFKDDFPYVLKECYSYVYEHILIAFKENADELLTTVFGAQPVSVVRRIRDAAMRQIDALVDVIPEADPEEKKKTARK